MQRPTPIKRESIPAGCLWAGIGGAIGGIILAATLILGRVRGANLSAQDQPAPVLTVIPIPSATAPALAAPALEASDPLPSETPPERGPEPAVGSLVEVSGTGADGLRIRERPGLEAPVKFLGLENEVFEVREGPISQDGFTWWLLHNPYDGTLFGWAVSQYLRVLEP